MARRKWNLNVIDDIMKGENPFIQSGYSVAEKKRKIGEEYRDSKGNLWKQIDATTKVKVNRQADSIRDLTRRICSVCSQDIDYSCNRLDHKAFSKTGKCYDCLEKEEFLLIASNNFVKYEKIKIINNKLSILKDFKQKVIESIDYLKKDTGKMGLVMENGEFITWTGKSNPQWLIDAEKDFEKVNNEIEKMEKELSEIENINNNDNNKKE